MATKSKKLYSETAKPDEIARMVMAGETIVIPARYLSKVMNSLTIDAQFSVKVRKGRAYLYTGEWSEPA